MNIAAYIVGKVEQGVSGYAVDKNAARYYRRACAVSMQSVLEHLKGVDAVDIITAKGKTWNDFFYERCQALKRWNKTGNNVILMDADSLLIRPLDFNWNINHMVLWYRACCDFPDTGPFKGLPQGTYRGCGQAYFPASMDQSLWNLCDKLWQEALNWEGEWKRHDTEQYILNRMYFKQGVDPKQDDDPRMNYFAVDNMRELLEMPDVYFYHPAATRGRQLSYRKLMAGAWMIGLMDND